MTTQDKPAVGPLSAKHMISQLAKLQREQAGWASRLGQPGCAARLNAADNAEALAWAVKKLCDHSADADNMVTTTAPADVSTKPLETNTSGRRVKGTAKNEHVTAPVEAGGSERVSDAIRAKYEKVKATTYRAGTPAERMKEGKLDGLNTALAIAMVTEDRLSALRPQPSGETLQSLAQAFEDAMEGSHGAWAVSGDEGQAGGETREAVTRVEEFVGAIRGLIRQEGRTLDPADLRTILALLRPAAPDGGGLADLAARVTAEVKRGADGSHAQALGALSNIEAMVRSAIPASEGGRG